jgi:hypothetical protein
MRTVFAAQFEVYVPDGRNPEATFLRLKDLVEAWVTQKYTAVWRTAVHLSFDDREQTPYPQHSIRATLETSGEYQLLAVDWHHPDQRDATLRWATTVLGARAGEDVQFAIVVRIASSSFVVRPVQYQLGRPRIVDEVLGAFPCSINGQMVSKAERILLAADVASFVQEHITSPNRTIPVLVMSPDVSTEHPVIDAHALQKELLGLAHVVVLYDKWAGYGLTDAVGKALSSYNGYARLYWPGFTTDSDPLRHPLYAPYTLRGGLNGQRPFGSRKFSFLASIAAARFVEGSAIATARRKLQADRDEKLREQLAEAPEYERLAADLLGERDKYKKRCDDLELELQEKIEEIETYRQNLAMIRQHQQDTESEEAAEEVDEPENVIGALDLARKRFADVLRVYPSAREAAEASEFARPDEVLECLKAIAEFGRARFDGRQIGMPKTWFRERGFSHYRATESQTTRTMFAAERTFTNDGVRKQIFQHITLGGGDRKNCLQVYFDADDETKTMDIGYCGAHLPYASQTT